MGAWRPPPQAAVVTAAVTDEVRSRCEGGAGGHVHASVPTCTAAPIYPKQVQLGVLR